MSDDGKREHGPAPGPGENRDAGAGGGAGRTPDLSAGRTIPVFHVGDVVETRRAHPCGGTEWEVYRVGMDIGIRCTRCGRRVLVPRRRFERRVRRFVSRSAGEDRP